MVSVCMCVHIVHSDVASNTDKSKIYNCIKPGSLTQKYEAFRPLYFTWQDSSAGAMVGMTNK